MEFVTATIILWIIAIVVAHAIGKPKRRAGFLYGVFLGWIGVIVVALLPSRPEMTVSELESRRGKIAPRYYAKKRTEIMATRTTRECPFCKEAMRRDASVCPHCRHESPPWRFHEGRWWTQIDGVWHRFDEATETWFRFGGRPHGLDHD